VRPLRILQVVGRMDTGGTETWLLNVLRNIDRARFRMDFVVHTTAPGAYDEEVTALGSRLLYCPGITRPWQYARNFSRVLAADEPYNIVHSHVNYFSGLPLRVAARVGVPVRVAHSHTNTLPLLSSASIQRRAYIALMLRWISRYATAKLAVSEKAARSLFGADWRNDPMCRILYCGIDLAPFKQPVDREKVRAELGIPYGSLVVGHVGRFTEPKNHGFILDVAASITAREPSARLLLVGDGPLRPEIEARASELGIIDRVIFAGARTDVARLLAGAMDIFVFPSRYEGLALSLVEAQAAGLPCLFSEAVPPEAEVVSPLMTPMPLTQPPAEWAEAALDLLESAPKINRGIALAEVERSPFNIERSVFALQALYEEQVILAHETRRRAASPSGRPA
jgi:glycosyltransferase involved in cell wall biosynthesis